MLKSWYKAIFFKLGGGEHILLQLTTESTESKFALIDILRFDLQRRESSFHTRPPLV